MFERPHHRRIASVLQTLDGPMLRQRGCLFGGGTAIALRFGELLRRAVAKAEGAYGDAIRRDLQRAIDRMGERAGWLERCVQVMGVTDPPAQVWQRIRSLRRVLA